MLDKLRRYTKETAKRIVSSYYFPFIAFGLVMLILHFCLPLKKGDDMYFESVLGGGASIRTWLSFMQLRYQFWSSRLVIESALVLLTHATTLWRVLDTLVMIWIAVALSIFFNPERNVRVNWFIVYAVFSYPFDTMGSAGWIATTLNYSWPFAFGLLAMLPVCNILRKKRSRISVCILSMLSLIYATNHEQMCAVMIAICGLFFVYLYIRDKRIYPFVACEGLMCLGSLWFILTCPGNDVRIVSETGTWFPEFADFSLFTKVEMGYSSSLYHYIMESNETNQVFLLFCIVLPFAMWLATKSPALRVVSVIPLTASLVMGRLSGVFAYVFPDLIALKERMTYAGTGLQWTSVDTWIPDLFITGVFLCALASVFVAVKDKKKAVLAIYLLLVGLASRLAMGLSPTIWASGTRTFLFMSFSFIAASVMLFEDAIRDGVRNMSVYWAVKIGFGMHIAFLLMRYMHRYYLYLITH